MRKLVESYGAVYSHLLKGHDRLYIDDLNSFYGALDGAGGAELSKAIVRQLPTAISAYKSLREKSQSQFMAQVISDMDSLPEGRQLRKSAGAFACVGELRDKRIEITYENEGDSSIYFFSKTTDKFSRIAHTPTSYYRTSRYWCVDTADFLGAGRSPKIILRRLGHLVLPPTDEWSIVGLTDGVQDDDGKGLSAEHLEEIIRDTNPQHVPDQILDGIHHYDDASVFIIQRPS